MDYLAQLRDSLTKFKEDWQKEGQGQEYYMAAAKKFVNDHGYLFMKFLGTSQRPLLDDMIERLDSEIKAVESAQKNKEKRKETIQKIQPDGAAATKKLAKQQREKLEKYIRECITTALESGDKAKLTGKALFNALKKHHQFATLCSDKNKPYSDGYVKKTIEKVKNSVLLESQKKRPA